MESFLFVLCVRLPLPVSYNFPKIFQEIHIQTLDETFPVEYNINRKDILWKTAGNAAGPEYVPGLFL